MAEARAEPGFRVHSRSAAWALERARAVAPLALRLTLAPVMLVHGLQKLFSLGMTGQQFGDIGLAPGVFWGTVVALVETFGGVALVIGLFTRLASFALFVTQLVAMLVVHLPNGFLLNWSLDPAQGGHGIEFNLVLLGSLLALMALGAGTISVDHLIHSRTGKLETRRTATPSPAPPSGTEREAGPGTRI